MSRDWVLLQVVDGSRLPCLFALTPSFPLSFSLYLPISSYPPPPTTYTQTHSANNDRVGRKVDADSSDGEGSYFGEMSLFSNDWELKETIRAMTYCEVYALEPKLFLKVLKRHFPYKWKEQLRSMNERAEKHTKQIAKLRKKLGKLNIDLGDDGDDDELGSFGQNKTRSSLKWQRPGSLFRRIWSILATIVFVYNFFAAPLRATFLLQERNEMYSNPGKYAWLWILDVLGDLFFLTDVGLRATLFQYVDAAETGIPVAVKDPELIAAHYWRTECALDLISTLPFDIIVGFALVAAFPAGSAHAPLWLPLMLRCLRLLRLPRIHKYAANINALLEDADISLSASTKSLIYILAQVLFLLHISTCVWYLSAALETSADARNFIFSNGKNASNATASSSGNVNALMVANATNGTDASSATTACNGDVLSPCNSPAFDTCVTTGSCTWLVYDGVANEDLSILYLRSVYWAIVALTTVGYGDIRPFTTAESFLAFAWVYISGMFYYRTVGLIASAFASFNRNSQEYQEKFLRTYRYMQVSRGNKGRTRERKRERERDER